MSTATLFAAPEPTTAPAATHRRGQLALAFQEAFTATVRLRTNRQVAADAQSFRAHIKQLVSSAADDARRAGYPGEYVKLAVYAFIAFLDESVLNSPQPMFAAWPRQTLQEEVFGQFRAGETFFHNVERLMADQDSEDLADVLEVYQLCLLLGFRGRYASADHNELQQLSGAVQTKIVRVRGGFGELSPSWAPPANETVAAARDPWIRRLAVAAASAFALAFLLYIVYFFALRSVIVDVHALATGMLQ